MVKLKGKTVLITGAAGGIGYCTALEFAKAGCELIISDINGAALKEKADELRAFGTKVHHYQVNIASQKEVDTMLKEVIEKIGKVDILINNAGIGHNAELVETSLKTWKKLIDVNFWGSLYHIYGLLPLMVKEKEGHIVNVSSGQAFFRLPTWSAYATIKLALGAFSEMLHFEVKKFGIKVTTVYPFMVNTSFYNEIEGDTYFSKLAMKLVPYYSNTPETVARKIFKAVKRGERVEMVNIINNVGFLTQAIPPIGTIVAIMSNLMMGKSIDEIKIAS